MARSSLGICTALALVISAAPARADEPATPGTCQLGEQGCFLDADGITRDADLAYRALHRRRAPHYLRAGVEMTLLLGAGTAWYWLDRERQVADWDFPSIKQRLTFEAVRFDNNDFWINFIAHPLDGAAAHALARGNHLGLAESFGYSLVTSLAWEYLLEFREKVSINDIIVTPVTGVVVGEFTHRLGQVLNAPRAPGTERWWHQVLGWTFGPTVAIHDWLDAPRAADGTLLPDDAAARADIWHALEISYGWADIDVGAEERQSLHTLRFDGRLAAIPGYLRPGRFHRVFADADLTALRLDLGFGAHGASVDLYADTMLVGIHGQRISSSGTGTAGAVGINLAYRYVDDTQRPWKDQLGIAHLPGLGAEASFLGRHASLRTYARVHGDFAGIRATPYAEWKAANPDAIEKSILRKQGYYYGWGWSGRFGGVLEIPHVSLGGEIFYGRYDSHEGLDRVQEELTHDIEVDSKVLDYELRLRVSPWSRVHAELAAITRLRRTRVDVHEDDSRQERYTLRLGLSF